MRILHLSDTHGLHHHILDFPPADVIVHSGDISHSGTACEILDFLNWFIGLPYPHKIFVTGNHDLCLWDAESIDDLPGNVHFLQDCGCEIDGVKFFGLAYNHPEELIPNDTNIVVTHEPPMMILDKSVGTHWGNSSLRKRLKEIRPRYHLFGHAHESFGTLKDGCTVFSNGSLLDERNKLIRKPRLFLLE